MLLRAEGLRRRYGGITVVDVDDLGVDRGEILAVLGPNGAGKSTLFRLLLLVERADAGRILLDGRAARAGDRDSRSRLAGVFQRPYLFAGTVADNVAYGLTARRAGRAARERRVGEMLARLDLEPLARESVHALSGGEAQRVAIARALAPRPEILLLDEPTANLDVTVRRRVREDLRRLIRAEAGAAVLITHDPADAFALADRIAIMEAGRIVQVAPPDVIVRRPATPFVAAFTGAELLLDGAIVDCSDDLMTIAMSGSPTRIAVSRSHGQPLTAGARVHVAYRPEDVMLSLPGSPATLRTLNCIPALVEALIPAGGLVRVRLDGDIALTALIPRGSVDALRLAPGVNVVAQFEAAAAWAFQVH